MTLIAYRAAWQAAECARALESSMGAPLRRTCHPARFSGAPVRTLRWARIGIVLLATGCRAATQARPGIARPPAGPPRARDDLRGHAATTCSTNDVLRGERRVRCRKITETGRRRHALDYSLTSLTLRLWCWWPPDRMIRTSDTYPPGTERCWATGCERHCGRGGPDGNPRSAPTAGGGARACCRRAPDSAARRRLDRG